VAEVVPLARMAALSVLAFEAALSAQSSNGAGPTGEVRYTLGRLAMAAPATAARCPHVRAVLPAEVLAAVTAQVSVRPATPDRPQPPRPAVSVQEAARALAITPAAVRAAAGRGRLRGSKSRATGEWSFAVADLETYRRTRAKGP
jgi:hypothetical protein